ncbi:MAG: hypothetical protein VZQ83_10775, partial [Eubacterium sp.]|nr:hypothetical protein [Eubacterium sp.]
MINFRGEIPYIEYESKDLIDVKNFKGTGKKADIRDYKPYNTGFIQVSRFRLSVAIAKSIFSKMPNKTLKRKLAYSYFIQLSLILTSIDDKIYIDYDTMKLFRDFSKNCR